VPAAAVIPAPQVYIYIAEVKKLVVGSACSAAGVTIVSLLDRATHPIDRRGRRCSSPGVVGG
jgi:hypothetical protein